MHEQRVADARASSGWHRGLNSTVTLWSQFIVFALVVFGAVWTEEAGGVFAAAKAFMVTTMKWYYIAVVAGFLFFVVWLLFSRYANIRLGKDDDLRDADGSILRLVRWDRNATELLRALARRTGLFHLRVERL